MQPHPGSKSRVCLVSLLLAVGAAWLSATAAAQAQSPPASYYGTAEPGDTIEALHMGTACAQATAGPDGFWSLRVSAGGACGIAEGGTLAFFRNGLESSAVEIFKPGGVPADIAGGVNLGTATSKPAPAPPGPSIFSGAAPAGEGSALLVTTRAASPESLRVALAGSGCRLQALAVLREGSWLVYIEGAPAAVNGAFPATLPQTSAFFARC